MIVYSREMLILLYFIVIKSKFRIVLTIISFIFLLFLYITYIYICILYLQIYIFLVLMIQNCIQILEFSNVKILWYIYYARHTF